MTTTFRGPIPGGIPGKTGLEISVKTSVVVLDLTLFYYLTDHSISNIIDVGNNS